MSEIVNAKGLACPQPVILTKNALAAHDEVTVFVDNVTAVENIKRLASGAGCSIFISEEPGGIFKIDLKRQTGAVIEDQVLENISCCTDVPSAVTGPSVFVIAGDTMGKGSDELGIVLMKSFIHTAIELETGPDVLILYNAGVKLAAEGSDFLNDLKKLEEKGVKILVCGTCVNYFNLTGKINVGIVSNMYDIAGTLSSAGRIVKP